MHSSSESDAIFDVGVTSMHSLPMRTTGQDFLHSCRQRFGLHLSSLTMAIRVCLSVSSFSFLRDMLVEAKCLLNYKCSNYHTAPRTVNVANVKSSRQNKTSAMREGAADGAVRLRAVKV